jgi:hypothetical protein
MNIFLYSIHGNVDNKRICIILEIYQARKFNWIQHQGEDLHLGMILCEEMTINILAALQI